jgi:rhodanese-related sulfurtransferase
MFVGFNTGWAADKSTDQMLNEARATVKSASVQDVKELIDKKEKIVLLDVRDLKDFNVDHLQGAESMSRAVGLSPRILEHHMKKIAPDKSSRVIVYCEFDIRAPLAVKAMNEIGYSNAAFMKGGIEAWKKAGYPLQKK